MTFDTNNAVVQEACWTYRVPVRTAIAIALVFIACTATLLVGELLRLRALGESLLGVAWDAAIVVTCAALLGVFLRWVKTVRLTRVGIVLNGLWRLPWTNVRSADILFVLGNPDVRVRALNGSFRFVPFLTPLHYVGHPSMSHLLKEILPPSHPIRSCIERANTDGVSS